MTRQEIFDKVIAHLLKQGRPAYNGGYCCYRTHDGEACAIGALIKDEHFNPNCNTLPVGAARVQAMLKNSGYPTDDLDIMFYQELQAAHDAAAGAMNPTHVWRRRYERIARVWGLKMPDIPRCSEDGEDGLD